MKRFVIILDYCDKAGRKAIQIEAPEDWGETEEEINERLSKELNNEEETFLAIGSRTIKRIYVEGAYVYDTKVNCN